MKKIICALSILLALALGCALAEAETTTVLVYMCGTNLQDAACVDLAEMAEADAGEDVNVLILAGGAKQWDFDFLEGGTRTVVQIADGDAYTDDWGYQSMGSKESLLEFLAWGLTNYPADRTVAVLWDHGAGSEGGLCFDELSNDDGLTLAEINEALSDLEQQVPGYRIDLFGCDACMMATYEMAAMLSRHNIGCFVASEEVEPGNGWNYAWLGALRDDPSISDEDLCAAIIETYMEAGLAEEPDEYMTLSAVNLSAMGALEKSMEQFATVLTGEIEGGNISTVRRGRSRMYAFGSFDDASWDQVDLGAVLDAYSQLDAETAAEAKRCLKKAVLLSSQTDNLDTCSGLSILVPQDTADVFGEYSEGIEIPDVIPNWVGFVSSYAEELSGGSYSCSVSGTCPFTPDDAYDGFFTPISWFEGCLAWDDEDECYGGAIEPEAYSPTEADQGFTVTLSAEDLANLDYVEGLLMMDLSDEEMTCFVDFGSMQNNLINWQTGQVVSLYDGAWPVFGGQPVPLYDQTSNEHSRRSLIPVKLNGEYTYLVVVFPAGGEEGRIIGANAGYDENGLPIRKVTQLKPGDKIVPVYTMYYEEEGKEDLQETEFLGDEILWQDGMTVTYAALSDDDEPIQMMFCFDIYDIFGEDTLSDIISFEL